ncbi:MAG: hypothetical protein M1422_04305 [Candidatus Thermoplasmatota archaeon]|nr:hypothetical protein [Candidatus Thermoplasmatota archaeon]MCL5254048.1 hypothetical protein [Candidatus Thermoplasmatota archaeon]
MSLAPLLQLAIVSAFVFFLPGFAAVIAFSDRDGKLRSDPVQLVAASAGISIAVSTLLLFTLTAVYEYMHHGLDFTFFIIVETALTALLLIVAVLNNFRKTKRSER